MSKLPKGWTWKTVAELAADEPRSITDGPFGSKLKTAHYTNAGPRVIRLQNIGDGEFLDAKAHISEEHFKTLKNHSVEAGDIVIAAMGESPPRACIVPSNLGPAIVKADCIRFKPDPVHSTKFLEYALNSPGTRRRAKSIVHGVGRPRLNQSEIKAIRLPVALPDEQRRIVARIEELFSRLDAGVAALRQAKAQLKRYRQSVLSAAVTGQLTQVWRKQHPDTEPAKELLKRILEQRRGQWNGRGKYKESASHSASKVPEISKSWVWAGMRQVGEIQLGRQRAPQHHSGDHMRPYLRVANVFEDRLNLTDVKWMNFTPEEFEKYRLRYGDLLLNEGQTPELVGRPAMYRDEIPDCCYQKTLHRFRAYDGVLPQYALTVFRAYMHNGRFTAASSITTNITHLTQQNFVEIEFPLPPLAEQHQIVAEVEARTTAIDHLEAELDCQITRSNRLRQSTLASAFTGELTNS